jgi:hypothetical protein
MTVLAHLGSRRICELSFGLIRLKPDQELGQRPLAAKQSVSRTPVELRNKNKQGEWGKLT